MIGAGTDNKSPVKGAVRWIPLYWSMSSVGDRYNSVWKIGSPVGISTGASYTMYIFFKQQVYNGKLWIDTETVKSMRTTFKSADLSSSKLPIPSLTSVSNKSKGIVFKWNKVTGCSGYMIYRKTGSGKWTKLATVKGSSTLSYTDRTAKSGNTYTYTVKAYKDSPAGFLQHHRIEDHPPDNSNPFFPDQHQIRQNQCKVEKSYRCIRISGSILYLQKFH